MARRCPHRPGTPGDPSRRPPPPGRWRRSCGPGHPWVPRPRRSVPGNGPVGRIRRHRGRGRGFPRAGRPHAARGASARVSVARRDGLPPPGGAWRMPGPDDHHLGDSERPQPIGGGRVRGKPDHAAAARPDGMRSTASPDGAVAARPRGRQEHPGALAAAASRSTASTQRRTTRRPHPGSTGDELGLLRNGSGTASRMPVTARSPGCRRGTATRSMAPPRAGGRHHGGHLVDRHGEHDGDLPGDARLPARTRLRRWHPGGREPARQRRPVTSRPGLRRGASTTRRPDRRAGGRKRGVQRVNQHRHPSHGRVRRCGAGGVRERDELAGGDRPAQDAVEHVARPGVAAHRDRAGHDDRFEGPWARAPADSSRPARHTVTVSSPGTEPRAPPTVEGNQQPEAEPEPDVAEERAGVMRWAGGDEPPRLRRTARPPRMSAPVPLPLPHSPVVPR